MKEPRAHRVLIYMASTRKDAEDLPQEVRNVFAEALAMALRGETHEDAKLFRYHGSGVYEVVANHRNSTFREIYTVRYPEVVYVIHIFQKKSKKGIQTPKQEVDLIQKRLKWAEEHYRGEYGKKR
jgi:phage-related protein